MKGKILRGRSVKRVLSVVFALAMIFTMLPLSNMTVHAESTTEKPTVLLGWNLTYTGDNWWFVAYTNRWFCCSDAEGLGIKLDESSTDNFMINNSWIDNTELVAGTYTCGHCGATLTLSPNTPTHTAAACEGRYFYENEVEFWYCDKGDRISVGDILSGNIKFDKLGDSSSYLDSVEMSSEDLLSNALVVKIDGD